ncbi:hypothetical protein, partial [Streptomyces sp. UNOC14_S4]|uniref:hypothetical protein n=1 Tax=Streptomyces sp. UNOC14_S4 TaxID=2872340 RepID=UPI001E425866
MTVTVPPRLQKMMASAFSRCREQLASPQLSVAIGAECPEQGGATGTISTASRVAQNGAAHA